MNNPKHVEFLRKKRQEFKYFTEKQAANAINSMIVTFNRRKKAYENTYVTQHTSGKIDYARLANYRVTDDIFQKIENLPVGKNHGIYILVDMSSSMGRTIISVVKQAYIISMFCKRMNIPFAVSYFTTGSGEKTSDIEVNTRNLKLITVADSNDSIKQIKNAYYNFFLGVSCDKPDDLDRQFFQQFRMDYTPLAQAMSKVFADVVAMKNKGNVEYVSLYCLTDGGDSEGMSTAKGSDIQNIINPYTNKNYSVSKLDSQYSGNYRNLKYVQILADMYREMNINVHNLFCLSTSGSYVYDTMKSLGGPSAIEKAGGCSNVLSTLKDKKFVSFSNFGPYDSAIFIDNSFITNVKEVDYNEISKRRASIIIKEFSDAAKSNKIANSIGNVIVDNITECFKIKRGSK